MKVSITLLVLCLIFCRPQRTISQTLVFTYDAAGNMIKRQLQIVPPIPPGNARFGTPINPKDSSEVAPPLAFKVYPNPAQLMVTLDGELPKEVSEAKIRLLTTNGQVLKEDTYTGNFKQLDVSQFKNGSYLLEVQYSKKQRSTYHLIISN